MTIKNKVIKKQLQIALNEVGEISPAYDDKTQSWVFFHNNYPVECSGKTPQEVIDNYPKYLEEFIKQRLNNNLNPLVEAKTKGRAGKKNKVIKIRKTMNDELAIKIFKLLENESVYDSILTLGAVLGPFLLQTKHPKITLDYIYQDIHRFLDKQNKNPSEEG